MILLNSNILLSKTVNFHSRSGMFSTTSCSQISPYILSLFIKREKLSTVRVLKITRVLSLVKANIYKTLHAGFYVFKNVNYCINGYLYAYDNINDITAGIVVTFV